MANENGKAGIEPAIYTASKYEWSKMKNWAKLLRSYKNSGIQEIADEAELDMIRDAAVSAGLGFYKIDLSGSARKESFLEAMAAGLSFPSYSGKNWDAFEEGINDLEWLPAPGYVIALEKPGRLASKSPADFKMALEILKKAAENWKAHHKAFHVIIAGGRE